jgi:hypothetical protein
LQIYIRSGCRLQSRPFYLRRPGQQNAADPEPTEAEMRARVVAEKEAAVTEEALLQIHKMPRLILCTHFIGTCVSKNNQNL